MANEETSQGRSVVFAPIQFSPAGLVTQLVGATTNMQIKVVSLHLNNNSGAGTAFQLYSASVAITGRIQMNNNQIFYMAESQPISPLFVTAAGANLRLSLTATTNIGGHISYYYENLSPIGR